MVAETNGTSIQKIHNYMLDGIAMTTQGETNEFYIKNGHGDVIATSNEIGTTMNYHSYDAFGNEISPNPYYTDTFRYAGEYFDAETDLIYLRNRYYNTSNGRFITEDPIKDGLNWYAYCGGNPVMMIDPLGLAPGDEFETIDEAAIDFAEEYYAKSYYIRREFGSLIYEYTDKNGDKKYSYLEPIVGEFHSVNPMDIYTEVPEGCHDVAGIHTHPNSPEFSPNDKAWPKRNLLHPFYVATNENQLLVWENQSESWLNPVMGQRIVAEDLIFKGLSIFEKIALTNQYDEDWENHLNNNCNQLYCKDVTFPRTDNDVGEGWFLEDNAFNKKLIAGILDSLFTEW